MVQTYFDSIVMKALKVSLDTAHATPEITYFNTLLVHNFDPLNTEFVSQRTATALSALSGIFVYLANRRLRGIKKNYDPVLKEQAAELKERITRMEIMNSI